VGSRAGARAVEEPPPSVEIEIAGGRGRAAALFVPVRADRSGPLHQVRDRRNQLVRTNHVAFADTDDALNRTVSRRHAHLEYVAAEHAFRVYDDGSEQGTAVSRGGRTIAVPPGARGVRLHQATRFLLGPRTPARGVVRLYVEGGLQTALVLRLSPGPGVGERAFGLCSSGCAMAATLRQEFASTAANQGLPVPCTGA
jgi:hypothetical protein